jgi:hypothetical protein
MRLLLVALLIASAASTFSALANSPAFNKSLRGETVFGGWRIFPNDAMYDPGSYAFQRGYGYLMADASFSADTEERGELASSDTARARARAASAALTEAVQIDPGNAHAWSALAWARTRDLDDAGALAALRAAWRTAPHNAVLAEGRLSLAGLLADPVIGIFEPDGADEAAIRRDAALLARFDERGLRGLAEEAPHLERYMPGP